MTRWLSFDEGVKGFYDNIVAIFPCLRNLDKDCTAIGLLKMRNVRYLAGIYILTEVLPIVSKLSKTFQKSNVNFTCIEPCIEKTIDDLDAALEGEIVNKFEEEFGTRTDERFYEQIHTGFKGKYS